MKVNIPALEIPTPQVVIQFPSDWPLLETKANAAKRFGLSGRKMDKLCRQPGFPAVKMERDTMVDIPRAYDWLSDWLGKAIPLD